MALISKDMAQLLDRAAAGLSGIALRLARSGLRLLLQAYDWVLALLGKDLEQQARKQVNEWLDELKNKQEEGKESEGVLGELVNQIYVPDDISGEVEGWLKVTQADAQ